jgi:hypothetical protein
LDLDSWLLLSEQSYHIDALAEWLRRVPAKYMGFPRESSNLSGVDIFFFSSFDVYFISTPQFAAKNYSFIATQRARHMTSLRYARKHIRYPSMTALKQHFFYLSIQVFLSYFVSFKQIITHENIFNDIF